MIDKDYIKSYMEKKIGQMIKRMKVEDLETSFETRISILYSDNSYQTWVQCSMEENQNKILEQEVRRYKSAKRKKAYIKTKE